MEKVNNEISQGLVSEEQKSNFEHYFNNVISNYNRVFYIYHLLMLPPAPIRKLREYFLKKKMDKQFAFNESDTLEGVEKENLESLEAIENELKEDE